MSARTARIRRLVAVAESRRAAKERVLGEARAQLDTREDALSCAAAASAESADRWLDAESSDDLAMASARRRTLARRVELETKAVEEAAAMVRAQEAAAVTARQDERRLEILVENLESADAVRRAKGERKISDEHAARMGKPV